MKFKFRFAYYLFGALLGTMFVVYFLSSKAENRHVEFCYLPNCRVLQELRNKPLEIDSLAKKTLNQQWVNIDDIKRSLTYGDVDFSRSNIEKRGGKYYRIEGKTSNNQFIEISMINLKEKVILESIKKMSN